MRFLYFIFIALCLVSCRNKEEPKNSTAEEAKPEKKWSSFENKEYQIALKYPENYKIAEDSLAVKTPVINVYSEKNTSAPPYGIHEDFDENYIAFLPEGFGVDGPSGERQNLLEFGNPLALSFEINLANSTVYLLENGNPWGFYLSFNIPPKSWNEYGGIFIRYPVSNFEAICLGQEGEISMENCHPMGREHQVVYRGEVLEKSKTELNNILKSLHFLRKDFNQRELSDLIKVEFPKENDEIHSPLEIEGEARGKWFFEANAGIEILDGNFQRIGEGYIKVENADWMTEDFVPFTGEVAFEKPDTPNGYVVFKKANASGKPELDRIFRIPVKF